MRRHGVPHAGALEKAHDRKAARKSARCLPGGVAVEDRCAEQKVASCTLTSEERQKVRMGLTNDHGESSLRVSGQPGWAVNDS